jgi:hypothetical protein
MGCNEKQNTPFAKEDYLVEALQLAHVDTSKNTLLHVINDGDCLTCIAAGKTWFRILNDKKDTAINVVFIIREMSDLKMHALFNERFPSSEKIIETDSLIIIRNTGLLTNLQNSFNPSPHFSFMMVVGKGHGLLFNKKLKDGAFLREAVKFLR